MNAYAGNPTAETHASRRVKAVEEPQPIPIDWMGRAQLVLGLVAAVAAVLLVVVGALNRSLQVEVAAGQARIASAQTAATVNNNLIRLLAKAAAEKNDPAIRDLLARNGITYRAAAPTAATQEATP